MRQIFLLVLLGSFVFTGGCAYQHTYQIPLAPQVGNMGIDKPIPLAVGLLISEESRNRIFTSAPYPDRQLGNPIFSLEPYQLPIGQAFEKAAVDIFPRVFQKVTFLRTPEEAGNYPVVLEPRLEDFSLQLAYYQYLAGPRSELVDGRCKVRIAATLTSRGNPVWQKKIETPLKTERWVGDYWLGKSVGELASETIVLALKDLAYRLVEESQPPAQPTRGWLEEIDRVKR
jgi:hypothetical protein